jgi:hypothetical protein
MGFRIGWNFAIDRLGLFEVLKAVPGVLKAMPGVCRAYFSVDEPPSMRTSSDSWLGARSGFLARPDAANFQSEPPNGLLGHTGVSSLFIRWRGPQTLPTR